MSEREFTVLDQDQCWQLVRTHVVGRIALPMDRGEAPLVFPINYIVDGENVVFRTDIGTKLAMVHNHPVAFEVDHVDLSSSSGWSVLMRGVAYEMTHWESEHIEVSPWAPGDKDHFVRIIPFEVTGRRITAARWVDTNAYL